MNKRGLIAFFALFIILMSVAGVYGQIGARLPPAAITPPAQIIKAPTVGSCFIPSKFTDACCQIPVFQKTKSACCEKYNPESAFCRCRPGKMTQTIGSFSLKSIGCCLNPGNQFFCGKDSGQGGDGQTPGAGTGGTGTGAQPGAGQTPGAGTGAGAGTGGTGSTYHNKAMCDSADKTCICEKGAAFTQCVCGKYEANSAQCANIRGATLRKTINVFATFGSGMDCMGEKGAGLDLCNKDEPGSTACSNSRGEGELCQKKIDLKNCRETSIKTTAAEYAKCDKLAAEISASGANGVLGALTAASSNLFGLGGGKASLKDECEECLKAKGNCGCKTECPGRDTSTCAISGIPEIMGGSGEGPTRVTGGLACRNWEICERANFVYGKLNAPEMITDCVYRPSDTLHGECPTWDSNGGNVDNPYLANW